MTVSFTGEDWLDNNRVWITWTSTVSGATFYVYRDGELTTTTSATRMLFVVGDDEDLCLDVRDDTTDPDYAVPGNATLSWWPTTNAAQYKVEEYVDSAWVEQFMYPARNEGFFSYKTRWLGDGYSSAWRVTPIGEGGLAGTAIEYPVRIVRHPSPPAVTYSALGSGVVQIDFEA